MKLAYLHLLVSFFWWNTVGLPGQVVATKKGHIRRETWHLKRMNRVLAAVNHDPCESLNGTSSSLAEVDSTKAEEQKFRADRACYRAFIELQALPRDLKTICDDGSRARCRRLRASREQKSQFRCTILLNRTAKSGDQGKNVPMKRKALSFSKCASAVVSEFAQRGQFVASNQYEDPVDVESDDDDQVSDEEFENLLWDNGDDLESDAHESDEEEHHPGSGSFEQPAGRGTRFETADSEGRLWDNGDDFASETTYGSCISQIRPDTNGSKKKGMRSALGKAFKSVKTKGRL